MAHTGIYATSDEILVKAGENVDATGTTEARINALALQSESLINCVMRKSFTSAQFAALGTTAKYLLSEASSNFCAIYLIMFNMAGYTSRTEAEDMINVLRDGLLRALALLRDKEVWRFMNDS